MYKREDIIQKDAELIVGKIDLSELIDKDVLITGASGLVGTYFLATLREFFVDNVTLGKVIVVINNARPHHLKWIENDKNFDIIKGDLSDVAFCNGLPQADYIIHAAGYGQPGKFMQDAVKTIKLNTTATLILLEKLKMHGKFLFVSTSEVYSGSEKIPYKESDVGCTTPLHDRACYIEGKRCGEAICNAYRVKGINAKSVRLALAYGPGTRPDDQRALNSFIRKAFQGEITLMDKGEAKRTYCYVKDAVEIMWNVLLNGSEAVYNVGGHSHTTIGELAQRIGAYLNAPVVFPENCAGQLEGAPMDVYLDMSKAEMEFSKKPDEYIDLNEGITRTIEWQRCLIKNKRGEKHES